MTRFALAASLASVLILFGGGLAIAAPASGGSISSVSPTEMPGSGSLDADAPDTEAPTDITFSLASPGPFVPGDTITINWSVRDSSPIMYIELAFVGQNDNHQALRLETSSSSEPGIQQGTATASVNIRTWEADTYTLWAYSFADEHWNTASACTNPLIGCTAPVDFPALSFDVTDIEVDTEAPQLRDLTMATPERVRPGDAVSFDWEVSDAVGVRFLMLIFEKPRVDLDCDPLESPCSELIVHTMSDRSSTGTTHRGRIGEIVNKGFSWQTGTYTLKQVYVEDFDRNVTRLGEGDPAFPSMTFTVTHKASSPSETPTATANPTSTIPTVQPTATAGTPSPGPSVMPTRTPDASASPTASPTPTDSALPATPSSTEAGAAGGSAPPTLAATGGDLGLPVLGAALLVLAGAGALSASRKMRLRVDNS